MPTVQPRDAYYSRVLPLLGDGLREQLLAVQDLSLCARVVELLRSCRLEQLVTIERTGPARWPLASALFDVPGAADARLEPERLAAFLDWRNGFTPLRWCEGARPSLTLVGERRPAGQGGHIQLDAARRRLTLAASEGDLWSWLDLSSLAARVARDLLLGRRPWQDQRVHLGHPLWPFARGPRAWPSLPAPPRSATPGHIMVIGCGSVGSELVRLLDRPGRRWTLVDDGMVSIYNPLRQWFGTEEIGARKVEVLAGRLGTQRCRILPSALGQDGLAPLDALLDADRPDLVVLSTGTQDHGPLAERLWQRGLPHLAACAYPQARVFELALVDPDRDTPCLHCYRGRLYAGPAAPPPVDDALQAFLYRQVDEDERDRLYRDLVAEPASQIETARIAEVAARCADQLLRDRGAQELWFQRLLAEETTCLLGANEVSRLDDGSWAYGLEQAGQVLRLGVDDMVESSAQLRCQICGRSLRPGHVVAPPRAERDIEERALLELARAS